MKVTLKLTKDHLKLIPFFFIQENEDYNEVQISGKHLYNLGSHLLEDMAMILGLNDKKIPNTIDDAEGAAFEKDAEDYMLGLHDYVSNNLTYIETLIHQFVIKGGLTEGTYEAENNELLWKKID